MLQTSFSARIKHVLSAVVLVCLTFVIPGAAQTSHWLTGYYATYNYSVMSTSQLDYTKLTHVIYWPVIPNSSSPGTLNTTPFGLSPTTFANGATDLITRAHAAGAKALIGIGGDESSGATAGFQVSTNSTYQATFIKNIVALTQQYGFDGVDINWEQIQTSDNSDFTSFIANLRAALNTASPNTHLLLTMPPETKPNGGRPDLLAQVYQDLDQINIQTYQMSGPYCGWETWYNSPLNNGGATFALESSEQLPSITNAIADYTSVGIPESLLAMGIQFDSEVWTGGQGTSTGGVTQPKQTWTGDGNSAYCSTTNPSAPNVSTLAYRLMVSTLATAPGYTTNFDSTADQSWLSYDPSGTGATNESQDSFVSFDSPTSIAKKGVDLSSMPSYPGVGGNLGGAFIFELSGDFASSAPTAQQHPLLNAAHSMQMLLPGIINNLSVTTDSSSIRVSWPDSTFTTSYNVAYSTTSGTTGTIINVPTNQAALTNLTPGQLYYIQVQPVNAIGTGAWTLQMSATFPGGLQTPTVTWNTEWLPVSYGTPLSSNYLNATASVPGTFVYTPSLNTVLPVGSNTVSLTFTPSSPSYSTVTQSGTFVVQSATISTSPAFGSLDVGRESNAHAFSFTFPSAGTLTSLQALTLGAPGLDFQVVPGGTCIVGQAYAAGASCQAFVTFSPMVAGLRRGAVVFQSGTTSSTIYISGIAYSGQLAYGPGSVTSIDGLPFENLPTSDVVDGAGNVYFSDHLSDTVWKLTPHGTYYSYTAYAKGFAEPPYNLALDGAGNLYVSVPGNYQTIKVSPSGTQTPVGSGYIKAVGLAVDGNGNLFISDEYANDIIEVTPSGAQGVVLSGSVLGANLSSPADLAIDSGGNLYLADSGNNRILKIPTSGSPSLYLAVNGTVALAMSNTDILYVADNANNRILALANGAPQYTIYSGNVLGKAMAATGLAVDLQGNLYIAEEDYEDVVEIGRSTPPSLTFASTYVGSTSTDSPKTATVYNSGNEILNFSNSTLSTGFSLASSSTCPTTYLMAGNACSYLVNFTPTAAGAISGAITMTDEATPEASALQQSIPLSGMGLTPATITLSGLTATYTGSPIAVTATTAPAGLSVSITYAGSATAPTAAGSYPVVATVTSPGCGGSASGTLVIAKATPMIVWPPPAPITLGTVLSATQLDATANVPGTFVYSPAAGTTPPAGSDTLATTFTPTDSTDYNTAAASVPLTVTAPRVVWIPDYYGGLLQVRVGTTPTAITIDLPSCNPNSVAVNNNYAYVVCNANGSNPDKILVYNAATIRAASAGTLAISPLQTITSSQFNSLIGITFDASNNLWVASYGNNQVDSISAATLNTANPVVIPSLINSPAAPVSLTFDSAGGIWVVGQYVGGILLHFPSSQINQGQNANPDYCLATANVGSGCQYIDNVFLAPEGVALFNGDVWVSNNSTGASGNVPGRELVDLKFSNGTLSVNETFGASGTPSSAPFVCPGGLFASSYQLWVNDESYGETNPQCGAAGDVASMTGGVFSFTPAELAAKTTTISQVLEFSNITGRPGFGGIFVENDTSSNLQPQTVTFNNLPSQAAAGTSITLSATAKTAVTFSSPSSASICTVSGNTASFTGAGTCTVTATAAQSSMYQSASTSQNINVLLSQTITFGTIPPQVENSSVTLNATASSGLTVTFSSSTSTFCTVSGSTATLLAPGTCSIKASQAGNSSYAAAIPVTQSFTVTTQTGLGLIPVNPCRVADTRTATGSLGGPTMAAGSTRSFPLPMSSCGLPATATAYSLNVTVIPKTKLSYLTMWPTGQPQPVVSTLNSPSGTILANAAIVPAGTSGNVSVYVTDQTDVIIDVNGYFGAAGSTGALTFVPLTPCRVEDTRKAAGPLGGPILAAGSSRSFPVPSSSCQVPASASAYSLNATVVPTSVLHYLTLYPAGTSQPVVSTLNSYNGQVVANAAIVRAGTSGAIEAYVTDQTNLITDINGYFTSAPPIPLVFNTVTPCRVVDTRQANGPLGGPIMAANSTRTFPVTASSCGIPTSATAYALNVTVVPTGALSYLTLWPAGETQPTVSTLNSPAAQTVANAALVPAGNSGSVDVFVTSQTHVLIDIVGYFSAP